MRILALLGAIFMSFALCATAEAGHAPASIRPHKVMWKGATKKARLLVAKRPKYRRSTRSKYKRSTRARYKRSTRAKYKRSTRAKYKRSTRAKYKRGTPPRWRGKFRRGTYAGMRFSRKWLYVKAGKRCLNIKEKSGAVFLGRCGSIALRLEAFKSRRIRLRYAELCVGRKGNQVRVVKCKIGVMQANTGWKLRIYRWGYKLGYKGKCLSIKGKRAFLGPCWKGLYLNFRSM